MEDKFMKAIKKIAALITAVIMTVCCMCTGASAASDPVGDASNGVVFILSVYSEYIGSGSGFAVGEKGKPVEYFVTNAHVVTNALTGDVSQNITVYFSQKANKFMIAEVYYIDQTKDICILKLPEPTTERKAIPLGNVDNANTGDTVYALGYPDYGTVEQDYNKFDISDIIVTRGVISKKARMNLNNSTVAMETLMTDAAISSGNSGGPMVDENGAVIGINTRVTNSNASATANSGIAVSLNELIPALDSIHVKYDTYGGANTTLIIIIAAAAVVVIAAAVVVVLLLNKKGKKPAPAAAVSGAAPAAPAAPAAAQTNSAVVVGVSGKFTGSTFAVNDRVVIGRNPEKCTVCYPVDTKGVSGVHCEIRKTAQGLVITDCGSTNGTFLGNGQKLQPNVPVNIPNGTYFYLASTEQMFQVKNV